MKKRTQLSAGDPAPRFRQATRFNPRFAFDTLGGRYIVLALVGSSRSEAAEDVARLVLQRRGFFDDKRACFFGVTTDSPDAASSLTRDQIPGVRFFFDGDESISRLYGARSEEPSDPDYRPLWVVIDPGLTIVRTIPIKSDGSHVQALHHTLDRLPPHTNYLGTDVHAPIIIVPRVLEPALCDHVVSLYRQHGGEESGFMREIEGKTVGMHDRRVKRRRDYLIEDEVVIASLRARFARRVAPAIHQSMQFRATRMERYIVACYSAAELGHFQAHRDNTSKGTAHRRFAATVNLNEDFDGGELSFPEYGDRKFRPPKGSALVFSCSLLHAVSPVVRGDRYAFLPFMYDDAAAEIRERNAEWVESGERAPEAKAR